MSRRKSKKKNKPVFPPRLLSPPTFLLFVLVQICRSKEVENYPIVVVGNKCDLNDQRVVTKTNGKEMCAKYDWPFFETSAKGLLETRIDSLPKKKKEKKKLTRKFSFPFYICFDIYNREN